MPRSEPDVCAAQIGGNKSPDVPKKMARRVAPPPLDRNWALFVDVDGTLLEIAPDPGSRRVF